MQQHEPKSASSGATRRLPPPPLPPPPAPAPLNPGFAAVAKAGRDTLSWANYKLRKKLGFGIFKVRSAVPSRYSVLYGTAQRPKQHVSRRS